MLLFLCLILVNNAYYIEGGLLGIYILSEVLLSRLREVQYILDNLKKEKEKENE